MRKGSVWLGGVAAVALATPFRRQRAARQRRPCPTRDSAVAPQVATTAPVAKGTLTDIVVTAQKREQAIQDVPVAVTAISDGTPINRNVATVTDLTRLAPSLTALTGAVPTKTSLDIGIDDAVDDCDLMRAVTFCIRMTQRSMRLALLPSVWLLRLGWRADTSPA
ncbi:hypothetical protein GCM10008023_09320 [Sphingomonas glacialis]|uniref:TonB-dependent receptor plug domain-containing protein n=1 Tax=Sphingomonas glacialis TaxID=658225 RepID=A0ABQ3LBY7_9SPHN|nr:hypothetical protein GCM10008023_09320 [Sphingomonas glacialis]